MIYSHASIVVRPSPVDVVESVATDDCAGSTTHHRSCGNSTRQPARMIGAPYHVDVEQFDKFDRGHLPSLRSGTLSRGERETMIEPPLPSS